MIHLQRFSAYPLFTQETKHAYLITILENYQTALDDIKIYQDFIINCQAPEIDKTLAPPVKIVLDANNIE